MSDELRGQTRGLTSTVFKYELKFHSVMTSEAEFELVYARLRAEGTDSWDVEVKRASGGAPNVAETLCAFGNMPDGGTIIFGLDERARFTPVGVNDPASLEQGVASQARQRIEPAVQVGFWRVTVKARTLVIAHVSGLPSHQKPCRMKASRKAYLRFADGDCTLSEQEVQQNLSARERPRNDSVAIVGTSRKDLDPDLTQKFLASARAASKRLDREDDEQILRMKRIVELEGDQLTLAGLYALGRYPQQFVPSLSLTAVLRPRPGTNDRNADRQVFDGPLPEILDEAVRWVVRNVRTKVRFGADGHGMDASEVPVVAIREIIANALVHRDLSQHTWGKEVQLILDNDRLIVVSPGGLWGLTVDQLGKGNAKSAVNEFLYDICQLTTTSAGNRVIEGEGGGLREVRSALRRAGMKEPQYFDAGVAFTAILPRHSLLTEEDFEWLSTLPHHEDIDDMQRQVLVSMHRGQTWMNQSMREEFGPLDSTEARTLLQGLVNLGLVETSGGGRGTSYQIKEVWGQVAEPTAQRVLDGRPQEEQGPTHVQRIDDSGPTPRTGDEEARRRADETSRHGLILWRSLAEGRKDVHQLGEETGLSLSQIRYALPLLMRAGLVVRDGGQGNRRTTYRSSPTEASAP